VKELLNHVNARQAEIDRLKAAKKKSVKNKPKKKQDDLSESSTSGSDTEEESIEEATRAVLREVKAGNVWKTEQPLYDADNQRTFNQFMKLGKLVTTLDAKSDHDKQQKKEILAKVKEAALYVETYDQFGPGAASMLGGNFEGTWKEGMEKKVEKARLSALKLASHGGRAQVWTNAPNVAQFTAPPSNFVHIPAPTAFDNRPRRNLKRLSYPTDEFGNKKCRLCGSTTHLAQDCPAKQPRLETATAASGQRS